MSTLQVLDHRRVLPAELADDPARATRSSDKGPAPPPAGGRDVPGGFRRFVWTASRLSPVLAISAAALTVVLYLGDWPYGGNRALQLLFAFGLGAVFWVAASALAFRDLTSVWGAGCTDTYEELRGRVLAATARVDLLRDTETARTVLGREAITSADELLVELKDDLQLSNDGHREHGSPYRWPLGHGYVNAWRQVHQVEDLLLAVEPPEVVYAAALTSLDRVTRARPVTLKEPETRITEILGGLLDRDGRASSEPEAKAGAAGAAPGPVEPRLSRVDLSQFDSRQARAVVRESAQRVHKEQNDAWDKIVNLRNGLFLLFVLAVWLTYGLLALVVLQPYELRTELTAATAFFLVGAVVGVFNELWSRSTRNESTVFDYGLGQFRLLATPVLSGLAALGGVLVTNVLGSYLVEGAGRTEALDQIFDVERYPMGLVVAAIFGLTPGLLLDRLTARKDEYDKQIAELSASAEGKGSLPPGTTTHGS